jgi:O-acetylhomoserine (thiol)-lyase
LGGVLTDMGNFDWKNTKSEMVKTMLSKAGTYAYLAKCRKMMLTNAGSSLAPFNAYLLHQGLETLGLRMDRHCDNALALAEFFAQHEGIAHVNYPGLSSSAFYHIAAAQYHNRFGALLTIRLGTKDRCYALIRALKIAKNQANLGDSKTLVIHPESTIYRDCTPDQQLASGVYPDLIRISVGLEHITDLTNDFDQALKNLPL